MIKPSQRRHWAECLLMAVFIEFPHMICVFSTPRHQQDPGPVFCHGSKQGREEAESKKDWRKEKHARHECPDLCESGVSRGSGSKLEFDVSDWPSSALHFGFSPCCFTRKLAPAPFNDVAR
jgi:hypothetical protein